MDKKPKTAAKRFWVLAQHNEIQVMEAAERPSTAPVAGERMKKVRGPYATKDEAASVAAQLTGRTLRAQVGR